MKALDSMDLAALRAVKVAGEEIGQSYASTDRIRAHHDGPLPIQRLSGLQRRGFLFFDGRDWNLTAKGDVALDWS